jgi:putative inorganic carbon (hco3(-)) transporter
LTEQLKLKWTYGISGLFILLNAFLVYENIYWGLLLPLAAAVVLLGIYAPEKVFFIIVFFTPLSLNIAHPDFNLGVSLPTEPLMAGLSILFLFSVFYNRHFDLKLLNHPISLAILASLLWTFVTCFTSEMPLVSLKFLVVKLWFIIPFFYMGSIFFKNTENISKFFWLFIISMSGVVVYTVIRHSGYAFEHKPAHWVMEPFFNDHTSYGAILVMFYPVFFLFFRDKKSLNTTKLFAAFLFIIFSAGILLSYTRAAWLSLIFAIGLGAVYFFKIKFTTLFWMALLLTGIFFAFKNDVVRKLEKNRQESSGNFTEHIQSMSNVTSDASNLERLNRWQSAFRMFKERPVFGWGPGVYSFKYAPFQHSKEKTIISTNAGNMGNAHSEYIGPLAEQGVLGLVSFVLILACIYYTATKLYINLINEDLKWTVLITTLGFTTYVVHGFLNNFLDTDKAAVPFWGFAAIITAIDVYHKKKEISNQRISL